METIVPIKRKTKSSEETNVISNQQSKAAQQAPAQKLQQKSGKVISFLNGAITTALVAIAFGVPVFFTGLTLQGLSMEKQLWFYVWILIGIVAWVIKASKVGEMPIRRTPLDYPILAVIATYILSVLFSVDRWHSFWGFFGDPSRGLMSILALALCYWFTVSNFTIKRARAIIMALVASDAVVILWTILAIYGVKFLPTKIMELAPVSLMGSFGALSSFFAMMLPILAMCILLMAQNEKLNKLAKISGIVACSLLTVGNLFLIFALYVFAPWLALVVGISFFLIYVISGLVSVKDGWSWVPIGIFVAVLSFLLIGSSFGSFKIGKIDLPVEISPNYNLSLNVAKQSFKNNFFFGSGPGSYGYVFSKYKPQNFNNNSYYDLRFAQGTGLFFESISTVGALASIALIILVLSYVGTGIYLLTKNKGQNKIYSLGLLSAAFVFLISALSVQTQGSSLIVGSLISILAMAMLLHESNFEEGITNLSFKTSPKYALALAFVVIVVSASVVFSFLFIGRVYVADVYAARAANAKEATNDDSIANLSKAINIFGSEGRYYTMASQQYMILANTEFAKKDDQRNVNALQQYIVNATAVAKQGESLTSNDVFAIEALAQVYENAIFYTSSASQIAEDEYKKALELDPHNPAYEIKLGQLKMSAAGEQKDDAKKQTLNDAKGFFEKAISEKPDFAPAYYNLGVTLNALGDSDKAIENMGSAVQLESNNVTYLFNLAQLYQKRAGEDDQKIAEALYEEVLKYNDKEINTHISLGILYEKMNKKDEAIQEYQKALDALPADDNTNRDKMKELMTNVKNGKPNTFESIAAGNQSAQSAQTPQVTEGQ